MASASASASPTGRATSRRAPGGRSGPPRTGTSSRSSRAPARVRWDRLARIVMLAVLAALLYLYISAGSAILSTWRASVRHRAQVSSLLHHNHSLQAQRTVLSQPATVVAEARRLGMVRPGEQAYVIRGLPSN